jgi:hypothetical protein
MVVLFGSGSRSFLRNIPRAGIGSSVRRFSGLVNLLLGHGRANPHA